MSFAPASPWHDLDRTPAAPSGAFSKRLASALRILLLRAGVERNPGPGKSAKQRRRQRDTLSDFVDFFRRANNNDNNNNTKNRQGDRRNNNTKNVDRRNNETPRHFNNNEGRRDSNKNTANNNNNNKNKMGSNDDKSFKTKERHDASSHRLPPSISWAAVASGKFTRRDTTAAPPPSTTAAAEEEGPAGWCQRDPRRIYVDAMHAQFFWRAKGHAACVALTDLVEQHLTALDRILASAVAFGESNPRDTPWSCVASGCPCFFGSEKERDDHLWSKHRRLAEELRKKYREATNPAPTPDSAVVERLQQEAARLQAERDNVVRDRAQWMQLYNTLQQQQQTSAAAAEERARAMQQQMAELRQEIFTLRQTTSSQTAANDHATRQAQEQAEAARRQLAEHEARGQAREAHFAAAYGQLNDQCQALMSDLARADLH